MIRIWRNFYTSVRIRPSDSAYGSLFAPLRVAKVSPEVFGAFAGRESLVGGFFAPLRVAKVSPEVFGAVASRDGLPEKFKEDRGGKR